MRRGAQRKRGKVGRELVRARRGDGKTEKRRGGMGRMEEWEEWEVGEEGKRERGKEGKRERGEDGEEAMGRTVRRGSGDSPEWR